MRRPPIAPALLALALTGCVSKPSVKPVAEPFVFRSLDLKQQDQNGQEAWELTSPEARYDIARRLAQARRPRGVIYAAGQPRYRISARSGTVIGDGEVIQLEGDVSITLIGANPVEIKGDQVRWLPRQDLMLIDRRPEAIDRKSRLTAQTARFQIKADRIELRGRPTLEQWEGPQGRRTGSPPPLTLIAEAVDWRPNQGDLSAPRSIRGERRQAVQKAAFRKTNPATPPTLKDVPRPAPPPQVLTAHGLRGNLREGYVDLLAPVRLVDPANKGWMQADQTRWWTDQERLTSDKPFRGAFNRLQVSGQALEIKLNQETVAIPSGCELRQPGEELRAQRCLWHWPDGRFAAAGDVVVRRSAYQQLTRASRLQGRIGGDGTAIFTAPGSRVNSRFTLPKQAQQGPKPRRAAPVVF